MKVVKPKCENQVEFHQIDQGQVFGNKGNTYIKVAPIVVVCIDYNCLNLETGKHGYVTAATVVRLYPHAEVILK